MLTFLHPWLFLLLPLPLLVRWLVPAYRDARPAVRVPLFELVQEKSGAKPSAGTVIRRRSPWRAILFALCWTAVVSSLARPQWLEDALVKTVPTRDLLLLVDLSGSMETRDFTSAGGETVDRLAAVKEVLDDFLTRREGDRVGLIVFGNAAFVQVPFTDDLDVCRQLLDETAVRMAGPKTALGDAIGLGINLFDRSDLDEQVMIALTDGNDTGSRIPPADAASLAANRGIVIHTVAVGNPQAAGEEQLDEEALQGVSSATGGRYFFGEDRDSLEQIYDELDRLGTREIETISHRPRVDLFHWPLALAVTSSLLAHALIAIRNFGPRRRPVPEPATEAADTMAASTTP